VPLTRLKGALGGAATPARIARLAAKGWIEVRSRVRLGKARGPRVRTSGGLESSGTAPELTPAQREVVSRVERGMEARRFAPILLHGVTGSGKTEVYLASAARALERGGQALVLVPEIALTPQLLGRFEARFPDEIAVLHSALTDAERREQWMRIREGRARIAVGARSAVFAPFGRLGLIVVDEEHESSYKQEEGFRYSAREPRRGPSPDAPYPGHPRLGDPVDGELPQRPPGPIRARRDEGTARRGGMPPSRSSTCAAPRSTPRGAARSRGPSWPPSRPASPRAGRRCSSSTDGATRPPSSARTAATSCVARSAASPHLPPGEKRLLCHYCDHSEAPPDRCPNCQGADLRMFGAGTERIADDVAKLFPDVAVERMDRDTTRGRGGHAAILRRFAAGEIRILVGTQMIAKGHDFPGVLLVGVVSLDMSLSLPDFRATERAFQVLVQVAGGPAGPSGPVA